MSPNSNDPNLLSGEGRSDALAGAPLKEASKLRLEICADGPLTADILTSEQYQAVVGEDLQVLVLRPKDGAAGRIYAAEWRSEARRRLWDKEGISRLVRFEPLDQE
jgi:hypothetical protein